jgi:DnaJ family protein C protein 7
MQADLENKSVRAILLNNRAAAYLNVRFLSIPSLSFSSSHQLKPLSSQMKDYAAAIRECDACLVLNSTYYKALRTRARAHLAQESWEAAVRDFKAAYQAAPAGSESEAQLEADVFDAEQKLKKSKIKVRLLFLSVFSSLSFRVLLISAPPSRTPGSLQDSWHSRRCY